MTRRQIDAFLASNVWEIAAPGVYRSAIVPRSFRQRCMVACLWSDPFGRISCDAAGALWQLEGIARPATIDVSVPNGSRLRSTRFRVHRTELLPADVAMIGPLRVTSPLRTVIDLAATVDERTLEIAIEDAVRRGLVSVERLRWRAAQRRGKGYAGSTRLAAVLECEELGRTVTAASNAGTRSVLQVWWSSR